MMQKWGLMMLSMSLAACSVPVVQGQAPVVAVQPIVVAEAGKSVHVCELKPFVETFRSEHVNRGAAQLAVKNNVWRNIPLCFVKTKTLCAKHTSKGFQAA